MKFSCVFNADKTRLYWDCPAAADLSAAATVEMELTAPAPEAVQSIGLYLKSGRGWYLWIQPLARGGRQKFFFQTASAATEGKPAGWNKINGVRVSFQNEAAADSFVILNALKAGAGQIILVKATSSAPDKDARAVARKTTARIAKWLGDAGVAHSILDDDDIAAGKLRSAAVIILPYNPQINDREMRQLGKLAAGGARLIVFYGSNPQLAEMLGMKLGKYQAAGGPGHWNGFVFNNSAPPGMPAKVIQESGNIYTVFPDSEKSRIIARWQDSEGKTLADPAWVLSEKGAWMTHVLQSEDSEQKKKMLLALLGYYDQSVRNAAGKYFCRRQEYRPPPALKARQNEFRGVWNHSGLGLYPGDWNKTCRLLAGGGITAVFPNMLWAGAAHFPSKYAGRMVSTVQFGDQMAQCSAAARATGLEIHVWKICWDLQNADKQFIAGLRRQGRLQKNGRNESLNWLCPSDPANSALEVNAILEVLNRYDVDGIHLDYIRYPDENSCYCAACRRRFENWSGAAVKKWPADVISGGKSGAYKTWRALQITEFVRTVRREMKKAKPSARLSAAVFGKYPECAESVGQDWGLWLREGTVDFVCPMDYFPSVSIFRTTLARQLSLPNGNRRVYPGIGATLSEGDLPPEIFLEQIRALRAGGAGGFVLFDLNPSLAANFLPLLGNNRER
ncbi:MAG: family 10 glycosylhydrolase [Kiritimatiellae bacterium]|nr:family 10 glycosylhydrolase [Kiritimatiellia bacterium]